MSSVAGRVRRVFGEHDADENDGSTPEVRMWTEVVLRALADGCNIDMPGGSMVNGKQRHAHELIIGGARRWFLLDGEDYRYVCRLIGLDAAVVRRFAGALFAFADEQRALGIRYSRFSDIAAAYHALRRDVQADDKPTIH